VVCNNRVRALGGLPVNPIYDLFRIKWKGSRPAKWVGHRRNFCKNRRLIVVQRGDLADRVGDGAQAQASIIGECDRVALGQQPG